MTDNRQLNRQLGISGGPRIRLRAVEQMRYRISSSKRAGEADSYLVDLDENRCSCVDFGVRREKVGGDCRHLRIAKLAFAEEMLERIRNASKPKRQKPGWEE